MKLVLDCRAALAMTVVMFRIAASLTLLAMTTKTNGIKTNNQNMKKLKLQFFAFTIVLICALGFFVSKAFQQIRDQEFKAWQQTSESVYNQFQARISDFLIEEDSKSFEEYQFAAKTLSLTAEKKQKGFVGYFQINPDGNFRSQFLANLEDKSSATSLTESQKIDFQNQHASLKELATNLLKNPKPSKALFQESPKNYVQLNAAPEQKFRTETNQNQKGLSENSFDADDTSLEQLSSASKTQSRDYQKIYPNPLLKKRSKSKKSAPVAKSKSSFGGVSEFLKDSFIESSTPTAMQDEEKPNDSLQNLITSRKTVALNYLADPFQARLINNEHLLFYRNAWKDNKLFQQGFVIKARPFFNWLFQQSFNDSSLTDFALAQVTLKTINQTQSLAFSGIQHSIPHTQKILFKRSLGYPLTALDLKIAYRTLPKTNSEQLLLIMTIFVFVFLLFSLFFIYRSTATQMGLALKKEDFVSAVTHELKTPLTSIRLSSELLNKGWLTEKSQTEQHYKMLLKESERLSRLIENVLNLSRLEKKKYNLNLKTVSPKNDLLDFATELKALVEQEGFAWETHLQKELPAIAYDADALKQILFNLVENSIKFSQDANIKKIELHATFQNQSLEIAIRDFGPGIPEKEIKKVFEKFYRVENELTRKTKGTGIGLSLVKTLVDQMGGKIQIHNEKTQGLRISLNFPISK